MTLAGIPWLFVMLGCAGASLTLAAGAFLAWRSRRARLAAGLIAALAGIGALYLVTLVGVSLASQRRVLAPGEIKRFCGVYLDCHLGVSVEEVRTAASVGDPGRQTWAEGRYWIVRLRVSSDARRAMLSPYGLVAVVEDERRRRFGRDLAAERGLLGGEADRPLEQSVEGGGSYTRTLVFDLPSDVPQPLLSVTERALPDVALEWFLIGDEDSLLHQGTLMSLGVPATFLSHAAADRHRAEVDGAFAARPARR